MPISFDDILFIVMMMLPNHFNLYKKNGRKSRSKQVTTCSYRQKGQMPG